VNGDVLDPVYLDRAGTFFYFTGYPIMKNNKNLNELLSDIKVQMSRNNLWAQKAQGNILFCNARSALDGINDGSKDIKKNNIIYQKCSTLKRYLDSLHKAV
jgi:hypothetical protein